MNYREIASKLNISPASLSLVVNHKPGVSDATRQAVTKQLNEMGLGYLIKKVETPAAVTTSSLCFLIYKRTGEILDQHPFFLLLLESIEREAAIQGYNVMIATMDCRNDVDEGLHRIHEMNPSGVIIFATEMTADDMRPFMDLSIPVVAMDNDFTTLNCNTVSINNFMGTFQAIEYLVRNHHKRIGYLRSTNRINSFAERELGYITALRRFSLSLAPEDIVSARYTEEGSYQDIRDYLQNTTSLPDAFVTDDDTIASGALRAFSEHGIRIPEDISIIGFNDRPMCETTLPPLTSINVSRSSLAAASVDAICESIRLAETGETRKRSRKIRIGTQLVERGSVSMLQ